MQREQVVDKVLKIMKQMKCMNNVEKIDLNDSLKDEYGFNSIYLVDLIVAIEEEFSLEFDETELGLENYENTNTVVNTVIKHLNNGSMEMGGNY